MHYKISLYRDDGTLIREDKMKYDLRVGLDDAPIADGLDWLLGYKVHIIERRELMKPQRHTMHYETCGPGQGGNMICDVCGASYCCATWSREDAVNDHNREMLKCATNCR